jgi:flagellar hook-length control protein FliK
VPPQGATEPARVERPAPLQLDTRLPVQGPRFADGMGQQIVVLAQHGIQQARMSLSPPEIGPVDVRITIANDEASVQLAAPTALARDAIQDALPKLREMMEQSGLRLQDAGVYAQLPQREQSGFGRQRDDGAPPPASPPSFADELDAPTATVRQLGLVDAYA